ncbi:MAG: hypothetical protein CBC48_14035 [bacterium TMED88]|nr:MAG: hypothetical protein CBC48_14035 [bacterium TMED88]
MNALSKRAIKCQGDIDIPYSVDLETLYGDSPTGKPWIFQSGACNSDDFHKISRKKRKAHAKKKYKEKGVTGLFSKAKYKILEKVCHFGRFFAVRTEKFGWHLVEKINGVSIAPYMQKPNWKNFCVCLKNWLYSGKKPHSIDATTNMLKYALAGRASDISGKDMLLDFLSNVSAERPVTLTTSNTKIFNAFIMVTKHSLTEGTSTIFDHFQFDLEAYKTHITKNVKAITAPHAANIWEFIKAHAKIYRRIKDAEKAKKKAEAEAQKNGRALNRINKRQRDAEKALETMGRMSKRPRNANNQREL